jgi:hypothetical protein
MRGWVGGAVGRDAQVLVEIARIGADISVGPYSSTAVPAMWSDRGALSRNPAAWAQPLKATPRRVHCSCRPAADASAQAACLRSDRVAGAVEDGLRDVRARSLRRTLMGSDKSERDSLFVPAKGQT